MRRVAHCIIFFMLLAVVFALPVSAQNVSEEMENSLELTLDEAIKRALRHSVTIKNAKYDVDRAAEVRDYAWDMHNYSLGLAWDETENVYLNLPGVGDAFYGALSADRQYHIQQKALEIANDAIELAVKKTYNDIIKKIEALKTAKLALEKAELDNRRVQVMANLGMVTTAQSQGAKAGLENSRSALEKAQADLEVAYRTLNSMVGFKEGERPVLLTPLEFSKLEVPSIDAEVTRALAINQNPDLWIKRELHELRRFTWSTAETQEAGIIDREKAWLNYEDARNQTRDKVHELYDNLKTLEASYHSALEGIDAAEKALHASQQMYNVGMITKADLLERELSLMQAKDGLLEIKSLYELTKESFKKPWLASASY